MAQGAVTLEPGSEPADGLTDGGIVHAAGQLAQFAELVTALGAPQIKGGVPAPVAIAAAKLRPRFGFGLFQGAHNVREANPAAPALRAVRTRGMYA